jgi:hypothetical protein
LYYCQHILNFIQVDNTSSDSNTIINTQATTQKPDNKNKKRKNRNKKKNTASKEQDNEGQQIQERIKDLEDRYDKSMYLMEYISNNEEKNDNQDIVDRINKLEEQVKLQQQSNQKMDRLSASYEQVQSMTQRLKMIEGMIEQLNIDSNDLDDETKQKAKRNTKMQIFF